MRYWYDTEFIENGRTIDFISIGIVAEDGREYYAQCPDFNIAEAGDFVIREVLPGLKTCEKGYDRRDHCHTYVSSRLFCIHPCVWKHISQIQYEVQQFLDPEKYGEPELWAWYGAYDHVAFAQLFGKMVDLPRGYPMYTRDLKQWMDMIGVHTLPVQEKSSKDYPQGLVKHNALDDARMNKERYEMLKTLSEARGYRFKV